MSEKKILVVGSGGPSGMHMAKLIDLLGNPSSVEREAVPSLDLDVKHRGKTTTELRVFLDEGYKVFGDEADAAMKKHSLRQQLRK